MRQSFRTIPNRFSYIFTSGILVLFLVTSTGCIDSGSNGTGNGTNGSENYGFIAIDLPTDSGSYTTKCNTLHLSGRAFISSDYFRCCSGDASDTGVNVSWENLTTGASGNTYQSVRTCYFFGTPYLCEHTWSVSVPLILGNNNIKITAQDPGGRTGSDSITIYKPEYSYSLSGLLSTYDSVAMGYFQSGVEMHLRGAKDSKAVTSSTGAGIGQYSFSCVPNGNYTLTPSTSFKNSFEPASRVFTVSDQDLPDLDFQTYAYAVTGTVRYENGTPVSPYAVSIEITSSDGSWSYSNWQDSGAYTYLVPNGTYTITPHDYWCVGCSFNPPSRTITVSDQGVSALDFVYIP